MFEEGQEVMFMGKGGFPYELERAHKDLLPGKAYTIEVIYKDVWGDYIYLMEVPNKSFKPTMFVPAEKDLPKMPAKKDLPKEPARKK